MPGKVKVRVLSARHLPVMDRSSENTDAFAEVKFGDSTHKTEVYRKSLNPAWNSEWFRFEAADDRELQDEPLQIRQVFISNILFGIRSFFSVPRVIWAAIFENWHAIRICISELWTTTPTRPTTPSARSTSI